VLANIAHFDRDVVTPPSAQVGPTRGSRVSQLEQAYSWVRDHVAVGEEVRLYVMRLCAATRSHLGVNDGASDRAMGVLLTVAKAWAALHGQEVVTPDDVKRVATSVLAHRLRLKQPYDPRLALAREVMSEVLEQVPVPGSVVASALVGARR
jgi:MoxR-like ATPase